MPNRIREVVEESGLKLADLSESDSETTSIACGPPYVFKGHERKALVVYIPHDFTEAKRDNVKRAPYYYIALSRARDRLIVIYEHL